MAFLVEACPLVAFQMVASSASFGFDLALLVGLESLVDSHSLKEEVVLSLGRLHWANTRERRTGKVKR